MPRSSSSPSRRLRLAVALAPVAVSWGGWAAAEVLYRVLECGAGLKDLRPCRLLGIDVVPFLGFGFVWCQLLVLPALLVSFALLLGLPRRD